jgi:hypothetical protein
MSGSLILAMGYGYEVKGINDRMVNGAKKLVELAGKIALPGAILVNDLPFCEYSLWKCSMFDVNSYQYDISPNGFHG